MREFKHGERGDETTDYPQGRRCMIHGWHGYLYQCEHYSEETLKEIRDQSKNPEFYMEGLVNEKPISGWIRPHEY